MLKLRNSKKWKLVSLITSIQAILIAIKRIISDSLQLAAYCLTSSLITFIPNASAAPNGGNIVGGSGSITQSILTTTINQNTSSLAINWDSYNLNSNEVVNYIQPSSSSIALNNILGNNASQIHGQINANGQVVLVNPNGIFFGSTASINVGGLIASGLAIDPVDFMNGDYIFNEVIGTNGTVINSGLINASLGGSVALIGKQVANEGVISAQLGSVNLAAGKAAVLTFDQQGLLGVQITEAILQDELGIDPAVLNSGEINAEGGRVLLTASVSQDVFSQVVNSSGIEQATSVVVHEDGSFTLGGGADVVNTGSLNVSSSEDAGRIAVLGENVTSSGVIRADAGHGLGGDIELHARDKTLLTGDSLTSASSIYSGQGGVVKILGDKVGLFDQSRVDASGESGGGEILIGGDYRGQNQLIKNASGIYVGKNVLIDASSNTDGDGGKIIIWGEESAKVFGNLLAQGGSLSGNGGFIETSGAFVELDLNVNVGARNGVAGTWLIDPYNLIIQSNCTGSCTEVPESPTDVFTADSAESVLTVSTLVSTFVGGGNVLVETSGAGGFPEVPINLGDPIGGNITLASDLDLDGAPADGTYSLTLRAHHDININARIRDNGGGGSGSDDKINLTLEANSNNLDGGDVNITDFIETEGGTFSASGDNIKVSSFGRIITSGNNANLVANINGIITIDGSIDTNGGNFIAQGALASTGVSYTSTGGASPNIVTNGGNVNIDVTSGVTILGSVDTGIGTFDANGSSFQSGSSTITADAINLDGINGTVNLGSAAATTLTAINATAITQSIADSGLDISGTTTFNSTGVIALNDGDNNFNTVVTTGATSLTLVDSDSIELGSTDAGTLSVTANGNGGEITQSGAVTVTGTTTLTATGDDITLTNINNNFSNVTVGVGARNVALTDTDNIVINGTTLTGTLDVIALNSGSITQFGALDVAGAASFTAADNNITLGDNLNGFSSVSFVGGNVFLRDKNNIDLGLSTISGALDVAAFGGGDITQSAALSVDGAASFQVNANQSIVLGDTNNNFAGSLSFAANTAGSLQDISVANNGALDLGNITVSRNLLVDANGAVTDSGVLSVGSVMGVNANGNSVVLNSATNNFKDLVIVDASLAIIVDANGLNIGTADASSGRENTDSNVIGNLNITTLAGNLTDEDDTGLIVGGTATLNVGASNIILDSNLNNFNSVNITQAQLVTLADANSIDIRSGNINGDIDVTAGSNITNNNGGLSVTGNSIFTTGDGGSIIVNHASNSFSGDLTFLSSGTLANISVSNTLATNVSTLDVSSNLTITSSGTITQTGAFTVAGLTTLSASGQDIDLSMINNLNQLTIVSASNALIDNAGNNLSLNRLIVDNDLALSAGAISDNNGDSLNIRATNLTLTAANGIGNGNALEIETTNLNLTNSSAGKVEIAQIGNINLVALQNNGSDGDITFTSDADINFHPGSTVAALGSGDLVMETSIGSFLGLGTADITNPDITAQNATFIGRSGTFGDFSRSLTLNVPGSVFIDTRGSFDPQFVAPGPSSLVSEGIDFAVLGSITSVAGEQLVEIESLSEIDPAIFTALRNYNQEEIAIRMPGDQLYEEE